MILLDTNVISDMLRPLPDQRVLAWLDAQAVETLYLSTINLAELRFGMACLDDGKRKRDLVNQLEHLLSMLFQGRILPFDEVAAAHYARLRSESRRRGAAISDSDGFIAAIASANGLVVATRDVSPFQAAGLTVINPWTVDLV
jgi:predicted nucleic acid-binding protein